MDTIKVVSASDSQYVQHLAVTFVSLLENTSEKKRIEFIVIDGGMLENDRKLLKESIEKYGCNLNFVNVDEGFCRKFAESPCASYATYYRIFLPELLDSSIEKVLYLDCDIVVKGDIAKLWETDITGNYLAAVEDVGVEYSGEFGKKVKENLSMDRKDIYFNAGVLIINLDLWRQHGISDKICDFLIQNPDKAPFADQDGLNAVLSGKWVPLSLLWNQQVALWEHFDDGKPLDQEMLESLHNPFIIHYTSSFRSITKPWFYLSTHPLSDEYYKYLKMTPWKDFVPGDRNFGSVLAKSFLSTPPGKIVNKYLKYINDFYLHDRFHMPEKLAKSNLVKVIYYILFPIGRCFMVSSMAIAEWSYYMERKSRTSGFNIFAKLLNAILLPSRLLIPAYARTYLREEIADDKKTCPCCGYKTIKQEKNDVCPLCYWQFNKAQQKSPDKSDGANEISLSQAKVNFKKFGASQKKFLFTVSKPRFYHEKGEAI
ncbi:glycosyltransferase [Acetivibrio cellulolyticus]|uniref:glycosyltransferase n=1 Tax=Acetivibrio cellulolyticus TaxID=35830 RepID=UPI0001E2F163|nr:glycosyltransferase [Acetivibrio cellulolyticus]